MTGKRKVSKKRQKNDDETDEVLKNEYKDKGSNSASNLSKKKRRSDENLINEKVKCTSADSTSCTGVVTKSLATGKAETMEIENTEAMVTENSEARVTEDTEITVPKDTNAVGTENAQPMVTRDKQGEVNKKTIFSSTLTLNEAVVLIENIKFQTIELEKSCEDCKVDSVYETAKLSKDPLVSERTTSSHNYRPLDDAYSTKNTSSHTVKYTNGHYIPDVVENQVLETTTSLDQEVCVEKERETKPETAENPEQVSRSNDNLSQVFSLKEEVNQCEISGNTCNYRPETSSASTEVENVVSDGNNSEKGLTDKETLVADANGTPIDTCIHTEDNKDLFIQKEVNFDSEQIKVQPADLGVAQNVMSLEENPVSDHPVDLNEMTVEEKKPEGLTDSQLCALDWMSQFPEEQEDSPGEFPDQIPIMPVESGDCDQQIEDGSTIIKGFIKELSNLNKMILKTKREMENVRRQRKK